jgi:NAD+--asparagine ADP-ribosyltransferase
MAAMSVIEATSASSLANQEDISKLAGSISKNMYDIRDNASDIKEIFKILTTIEDSIAEGGGAKFIKSAPSRIVADSSRDPINFYYC